MILTHTFLPFNSNKFIFAFVIDILKDPFCSLESQPAIVQCQKRLHSIPPSYLQTHYLYVVGMEAGADFEGHLQGEMALDDCRHWILGTLPVYLAFREHWHRSLIILIHYYSTSP